MPLRAPLQESGAATTADAAYQALRRSILQGDLAPGERLRSDALANEMKVSRTPVREALRKLEAEGLVERSGSGLIVREFSEQDLTELFYVREALEGMAARLAAENATPNEIGEIRELLDDMEAVGQRGDVVALRPLTAEYHRLVGRAAHNGRLLQSLESLLEHVRQIQTSTLLHIEGRAAEALKEHRDLLQAIEARDADGAERVARIHRRKTLDLRRQLLRARLRESRANGGRADDQKTG
ncbi:MAG TPA: GntR family transcriptional regulator [Xanthobacteraceae bacterium]|nr:GntR family transcriptional regulator [Xanthobacteraceae bacterium]